MADSGWYYSRGGQQIGPVDWDTLRQAAQSGALGASDLVWKDGMPDWQAASTVAGLIDGGDPAQAQGQVQGGDQGYQQGYQYQAPAGAAYPTQGAPAAYGGQAYGGQAYAGQAYGGQAAQLGYYTPGYAPGAYRVAEYAGFWMRFGAAFIDGLIVNLPFQLLSFAVDAGFDDPPNNPSEAHIAVSLLLSLTGIVVQWLYYAFQESGPHMATFGKRALGIVVTDLNGNRLSFGRATGRYFGKFLSSLTCLIGYIMAGFTERKQALHDIMASTLVVKKQR